MRRVVMDDLADSESELLPFAEFWAWLQGHPNCILRMATPGMVVFDADDFHWHFGVESDTTWFVQVIRGKRYVGELVINPSEVAAVRQQAGEEDEVVFDLLDASHHMIGQFVLSHGYQALSSQPPGRVTH